MVTMAYYLGHRFYLRKQKIRSLKLSNRIWLVFLSLFVFMLVILGMNFQWTQLANTSLRVYKEDILFLLLYYY